MSKSFTEAIRQYKSLDGVTDYNKRVEVIREALDGLEGENEIAKIATLEDEYLRGRNKPSSIGTIMSRAGYYKLLNQGIKLIPEANAFLTDKNQLKHLFFKYCGLTEAEWDKRNASDRIYKRLSANVEINPKAYLEKTLQLLDSNEAWELGSGLIAATGRRPHEMVARAEFKPVGDYSILFSGQGKKRGEQKYGESEAPEYEISCLVPAEMFIEQFKRFRRMPEVKEALKEAKSKHPKDIVKQNTVIDDKSNTALIRVINREFKEAGVLQARSEEENVTNTTLRSAYLALATKRDFEGSMGASMLFASKLAGHFVDVDPEDNDSLAKIDKQLNHLQTTLGYASYYVKGEVPFIEMTEKEKPTSVKVSHSDRDEINRLREVWELNSQSEVISQLITLAKERLEMPVQQSQQATEQVKQPEAVESLENQFQAYQEQTEAKFDELKQLILMGQQSAQVQPEVVTPPAEKQVKSKPEVIRDWEGASKDEVFGNEEKGIKPSKEAGGAEERVRRAVAAIMDFNNQFPKEANQDKKWSINIRAVRTLSGVNNATVKAWLETYRPMVETHNSSHGIDNQYHNRCHKAEGKTSDELIIEEVASFIK